MKNTAPFFIAFATLFSFCAFAQSSKEVFSNALSENNELLADNSDYTSSEIKSYRVEERINMNFGGRITTYEVSSLSLVSTNDLGPNNVRVVTPRYLKAKPVVSKKMTLKPVELKASNLQPISVDLLIPHRKKDYVEIDITSTYERILEKGYVSLKMLYQVANRHFFDGNLVTAAKWYEKLFVLNKDIESVYNYRFAQCLKAVGQTEKANTLMKVYEDTMRSK